MVVSVCVLWAGSVTSGGSCGRGGDSVGSEGGWLGSHLFLRWLMRFENSNRKYMEVLRSDNHAS